MHDGKPEPETNLATGFKPKSPVDPPTPATKKQIPELPEHIQQFGLCVIFHMLLPLLPLAIELFFEKKISIRTLTLTASIYSISIGSSSGNKLMFGISIILSLLFAVGFGAAIILTSGVDIVADSSVEMGSSSFSVVDLNGASNYVWYSIVGLFIFHFIERWSKHIQNRKPYFNF